jgi:hypothetical protein
MEESSYATQEEIDAKAPHQISDICPTCEGQATSLISKDPECDASLKITWCHKGHVTTTIVRPDGEATTESLIDFYNCDLLGSAHEEE